MTTRDEILTMEAGREMDALVSEKVMGYQRGDELEWSRAYWVDKSDPKTFRILGLIEDTYDELAWSPSTNIDEAWMVLEKFTDVDIEKAGENYRVTINVFAQADAHRAPLAICRAALIAVLEPA